MCQPITFVSASYEMFFQKDSIFLGLQMELRSAASPDFRSKRPETWTRWLHWIVTVQRELSATVWVGEYSIALSLWTARRGSCTGETLPNHMLDGAWRKQHTSERTDRVPNWAQLWRRETLSTDHVTFSNVFILLHFVFWNEILKQPGTIFLKKFKISLLNPLFAHCRQRKKSNYTGSNMWLRNETNKANYTGRITLIIKKTRCTNFSNLFWNRTLHVSDSFSVHHHCTHNNTHKFCWLLASKQSA